jgi:hypothetical protein
VTNLMGLLVGAVIMTTFCVFDLYRTVIELRLLFNARADIRLLEGCVFRGHSIQERNPTHRTAQGKGE